MAGKSKSEEKKLSFEEAISRLSEIADTLENSNPTLNDALSLYEEGAGLLKMCSESLENAQKKITVLSKNGEKDD